MIKTQQEYDSLYSSDSAESVSAHDLGISDEEYQELCNESARAMAVEGHVITSTGKRVYADT